MALAPRLDLRQTQSLVMTPQLQQAIKLLALSNLEIGTFLTEAIEANPLLEGDLGAAGGDDDPAAEPAEAPTEPVTSDELIRAGAGEADAPLDIDPAALDRDRDTGDWASAPSLAGGDEGPGIDERGAGETTLAEHLEAQVGTAARDPQQAFIARTLIGLLDEAGYLTVPLDEVAEMLGAPLDQIGEALALVQSLDPSGVGARSLAECLALQAREADRYDPCMALLIANLDLVARGQVVQLKRICEVDDEDFADMLVELRAYDPKPGLRFGGSVEAAVQPDILVHPGPANGGSARGWDIALNPATLPRIVVNRDYLLELRGACSDAASKGWLGEKLADANWLVKALDQRQRTILKVAGEIVRRQEGFFRRGVSELRPLTMRAIAEAIDMHESTVSRVASNKYLQCDRGTFELRYFFTSGVGGGEGEEGASSAAVKARIRALVDAECAVLSDDKLVELLRAEGFDLARRTVAKYREAIGIGSSVDRRRAKKLAAV